MKNKLQFFSQHECNYNSETIYSFFPTFWVPNHFLKYAGDFPDTLYTKYI